MGRKKNRLGLSGYARLLALLRTPMTRQRWQEAGPVGRTAAIRLIDAFHRRGRVHIVGWEMRYRLAPTPVWKYGPGVDAPPPAVRPTGKPALPLRDPLPPGPIPPELLSFLDLLDVLEAGQCSRNDLAVETGLCLVTVWRVVRALKAAKLIRIQAYHPRSGVGGGPVPYFRLGSGDDAPRPRPMPVVVASARYRQKRHQKEVHRLLRSAVSANQSSAAEAA